MFTRILRLICKHEMVRKTDTREGRLYLQCIRCGLESPGVYTGPQHQSILAGTEPCN
jgi:hypothetical protein